MNVQLKNNYHQTMDLALQLTINSGFLVLKDFYKLSKVDKFMNSLFKNLIEKYYDVLRKCSSLQFVHDESMIFKFNTDWNNIFGRKLNGDEMAIYYTYFVFKYHTFYKKDFYSKYWICILDENGFVKSFSNDYLDVDDKDIILKIQIHYSYTIYRNYPKKLNYWATIIKFQHKDKDIVVYPDYIRTTDKIKVPNFNPDCVNLKLLESLITSDKYKIMISNNFL